MTVLHIEHADIFQDELLNQLNRTKDVFHNYHHNGELQLSGNDFHEWLKYAEKVFDRTTESIIAIHFANNADWWETPLGVRYLEMNLEKHRMLEAAANRPEAKKGLNHGITRIFVYKNDLELTQQLKKVIIRHINAGIRVYLIQHDGNDIPDVALFYSDKKRSYQSRWDHAKIRKEGGLLTLDKITWSWKEGATEESAKLIRQYYIAEPPVRLNNIDRYKWQPE